MDHGQASRHISDWVRGVLDGGQATLVERHVAECPECRDVAETVRALVAEAGRGGAAAAAHPRSDELARYVLAAEDEASDSREVVARHLDECASCRDDVELMRAAASPGWWRMMRARLASGPLLPAPLQPAFVAATLLLIVPAWIGMVEAPRQRAEYERRLRSAEQIGASDALHGGGFTTLVLQGASRSLEERPVVVLRADRELQPVLLDVTPPEGPVFVRLVGADGAVVWSASGARERFWDDANRLVGVQIPAAVLEPGDYRVELSSAPTEPPFFSAGFRAASESAAGVE